MSNQKDDVVFVGSNERFRSWIPLHKFVEDGNRILSMRADQESDSDEETEGIASEFFLN
jgi:hypothetical protein